MIRKLSFVVYLLIASIMLVTHANADRIMLDFRIEKNNSSNETIVVTEKRTGKKIHFSKKPSITINNIKYAKYRSDDSNGFYTVTKSIYDEKVEFTDDVTPIIDFYLNEKGKNIIADVTSQNVGKRIGLFLNGNFITAPVISGKIDEGIFSLHAAGVIGVQEAKDLVNRTNSSNRGNGDVHKHMIPEK